MDEHFQRLADWIGLESVAEAERLNERRPASAMETGFDRLD